MEKNELSKDFKFYDFCYDMELSSPQYVKIYKLSMLKNGNQGPKFRFCCYEVPIKKLSLIEMTKKMKERKQLN